MTRIKGSFISTLLKGVLFCFQVRRRTRIWRPTVMLTCCMNHKVWDGLAAKRFLREVADILEGCDLEHEFEERRDETSARVTA